MPRRQTQVIGSVASGNSSGSGTASASGGTAGSHSTTMAGVVASSAGSNNNSSNTANPSSGASASSQNSMFLLPRWVGGSMICRVWWWWWTIEIIWGTSDCVRYPLFEFWAFLKLARYICGVSWSAAIAKYFGDTELNLGRVCGSVPWGSWRLSHWRLWYDFGMQFPIYLLEEIRNLGIKILDLRIKGLNSGFSIPNSGINFSNFGILR